MAGVLSVANLGLGLLSSRRVQEQLDLFRLEFNERVAQLGGKVDSLQIGMSGPEAEEALFTAIRLSTSTTSRERVRRMARVVAGTAVSPTPIWGEAEEFIRALEQINDADLEALNILWAAQRPAYRSMNQGGREFSTDSNDYNKGWKDVLTIVSKRNVSKDEWSSRCARLGGFGLAVQVPPNNSFQGTGDVCFRLTARAARLLGTSSTLSGCLTPCGLSPTTHERT